MISPNKIVAQIRSIGKHVTVLVAATLAASSCVDENYIDRPSDISSEAGYITIDLASAVKSTRAEGDTVAEAGVDAWNENLIEEAILCLYPYSASETDEPVYHTSIDVNKTAKEPGTTVRVRLDRDLMSSLFPTGSGNIATAYVVCNLGNNGNSVPSSYSRQSLKNISIISDFNSVEQESFVMFGSGNVTLTNVEDDPNRSKVTGTVGLTRSAAKISLGVNVAQETEANGTVWVPYRDNSNKIAMTTFISNGVDQATVVPSSAPSNSEWYYTAERSFDEVTSTDVKKLSFSVSTPFYTYPNEWAADSERMTYMMLTVPWKKKDADEWVTCYYTVPLNRGTDIVHNLFYQVTINVNILGSFDPNEPLVLDDCSYRAVPWGDPVDIEASLEDVRFLVLDQKAFTMNNTESLTLPFYSSHETVVKKSSLTFYLYNMTQTGDEVPITITSPVNGETTNYTVQIGDNTPTTLSQQGTQDALYTVTIPETGNSTSSSKTIDLTHLLYTLNAYQGTTWLNNPNIAVANRAMALCGYLVNGEMTFPNTTLSARQNYIQYFQNSTIAAYSRFKIEIEIVHKDKLGAADEDRFTDTFTVTQYPGVYIDREYNTGGSGRIMLARSTLCNTDVKTFGFAFVNASWQTLNNENFWWCRSLLSLAQGWSNFNMYIINVSALNEGDEYNIGDPRIIGINNLNNAGTDPITNSTAEDKNPANTRASFPTQYSNVPSNSNSYYYIDSDEDWCSPAPSIQELNKYPSEGYSHWNSWANIPNRTLSYYRPTNEGSETEKMLAPKLRVASEYSSMYNKASRKNIRRRCATYQERGYPAGRWRLPTKAEMEYIATLTASGKLPNLFNVNNNYWTAHGIFTVNDNGTVTAAASTETTAYVRPVYDDWYWKDELPQNTDNNICNGSLYIYTLGDME